MALQARITRHAEVLLSIALSGFPAAAHGRIRADIGSIGFPSTRTDSAGLSGVGSVRIGTWVPVLVDLTLEATNEPFGGYLRIQQSDRDGDICYDELRIDLLPTDTFPRRFTLYVVANPGAQLGGGFEAVVLDNNRQTVEVVTGDPVTGDRVTTAVGPAQPPDTVPDDHYMILSVSATSVGKVLDLQGDDYRDKFARPIAIARVSPKDLPNLACGLETVDCIVWDDADTTELSHDQLAAVIEWTRQGGLLLLATARTAGTLRQSALNDILPVDLASAQRQVPNLPEIRRLLGDIDDKPWDAPLNVVQCTPRAGAEVLPVATAKGEPGIYRRNVGRGHVLFFPAALRELFAKGGKPAEFFKRVLGLRGSNLNEIGRSRQNLFPWFERAIGFQDISAWYVFVAVGFAAVYVGVATIGTWKLLQSRQWTKHSWTAFALTAGLGSVASVVGVQWIRGIRAQDLRQLTIVDVRAGELDAYATAYFGLKTSYDRTLDLWLPSDAHAADSPQKEIERQQRPSSRTLRPMPIGTEQVQLASSFADPRRYRLKPASAEIEDAPFRATLKQFEGRWDGALRGRVDASVNIVSGPSGPEGGVLQKDMRVADASWIQNDLGAALSNCFLLYTIPKASDVLLGRDDLIYAFPLGDLPAGQRVKLADRMYFDATGKELAFTDWGEQRTLKMTQRGWAREFGGVGQALMDRSAPRFNLNAYQNAVLLLTTYSEFTPSQASTMGLAMENEFSRARARQLDIIHGLDDRHVLLIGFAEGSGPVSLCTRSGNGDYERLAPRQAWTVYRVLLPIGGAASGK